MTSRQRFTGVRPSRGSAGLAFFSLDRSRASCVVTDSWRRCIRHDDTFCLRDCYYYLLSIIIYYYFRYQRHHLRMFRRHFLRLLLYNYNTIEISHSETSRAKKKNKNIAHSRIRIGSNRIGSGKQAGRQSESYCRAPISSSIDSPPHPRKRRTRASASPVKRMSAKTSRTPCFASSVLREGQEELSLELTCVYPLKDQHQ